MKKIRNKKLISAALLLSMLLSVCMVAVAEDSQNAAQGGLRSRGAIRYQEGTESVVIDSADLYTLADRLDLYKVRTAEQLGAMGTYLSRNQSGTPLTSGEGIYAAHQKPSSSDEADPLSLSFETILEGIAASQTIPTDPADYGMETGIALYKGADGTLNTDGGEGSEPICIQAATAENLSAGTAAWVNGQLILGTGGDNKVYFERGEGSGSYYDDSEALKRIEAIRIGNAGGVYVVSEDMTDVVLVFFNAGKKHQLSFASDEVVPYKELFYKSTYGEVNVAHSVVCTMYFVPKLPKGTGINVPAESSVYSSYLVRVKDTNHKGGQMTKETISGSNYFVKSDMKDVLLLQCRSGSGADPAFESAPGKPVVAFKKIAEYHHTHMTGWDGGAKTEYYYSLYYIPNMPAGTTISKHQGGVLFYES